MSDWKPQLIEDLFKGRVILFLGQEYLRWASNQSIENLTDPLLATLKESLPKEKKALGLRAVCRELIERRGIAPGRVIEALHRTCKQLTVSDSLRALVQAPWRAIFTTAIDDVLSRSLGEVETRFVRHVYDRNVQYANIRGGNTLYVMHIQGAVDQMSEDRVPAFTEEDEDLRGATVRHLLDNLLDFAGVDGVVLIAGLDPSVESGDVCSDLWQRIKELPKKQCYWFDPPKAVPDDPKLKRLIDREIVYLVREYSFSTFLAEVEAEGQKSHRAQPSERVVKTPYGEVNIPAADWRFYQQDLVILDQAAVKTAPIENSDARGERFQRFLEGNFPPDWSAYASGFAFRRPVLDDIKNKALRRLKRGRAQDNAVFTVSGAAGCGKTVLLEQLAWELASEDHPVVYIPKKAYEPSFRAVEEFCRTVQPQAEKKGAEAGVRVVIIWDSFSAQAPRYEALASFLASLGKPALVIGSTYAPPSKSIISSDALEIEGGEQVESERVEDFPVPMGLADEEVQPFLDLLEREDPELAKHIDRKRFVHMLREYLLVALYDFVVDARERLRQGANLEYDYYAGILTPKLNAFLKAAEKRWEKLLPLVFVPSQYQAYPNVELVLHSMGRRYLQYWIDEKPQLPLEGLIEEVQDNGVLRLKARHPLVAQLVVNRKISQTEQLGIIEQLAMAMNPANADELEFIRQWFFILRQGSSETAQRRGGELFSSAFVNRHLAELIKILANLRENRIADFSLLHTEALFIKRYADNAKQLDYKERFKQFYNAINILQEALRILETDSLHEHRKAERQNIAGTLASIYSDLINLQLSYIETHPEEDTPGIRQEIANHQLQLTTYCNIGMVGTRPNVYVPHIRANALFIQYRKDKRLSEADKAVLRVEMLEELERAVQNFSQANLKPFLQLRADIEEECGDVEGLAETIKRLEKVERLSGYYMKARFTGYRYDPEKGRLVPKGEGNLRQAINILKNEVDASLLLHNAPCLALLGRLWWDLHGKKNIDEERDVVVGLSRQGWEEYSEILRHQLYAEGARGHTNLRVLFMRAWALFQLEYFDESRKVFRELERVSLGSRYRTASLVRLANEDGTARHFTGEVGEPRDETHWFLYCPEIRLTLPFQRYALGRTLRKGDPVDFEIRLNYSGAMAVKSLPPKPEAARPMVVKRLHKKI